MFSHFCKHFFFACKKLNSFSASKGHFHSDKLAEYRKPRGNRSDHLLSGWCARGEVVCKGFAKCNWFSWCRHAGTINTSSVRRSEPEPVRSTRKDGLYSTYRLRRPWGLPRDFQHDCSTHCCTSSKGCVRVLRGDRRGGEKRFTHLAAEERWLFNKRFFA